jgi:hypothetical protein
MAIVSTLQTKLLDYDDEPGKTLVVTQVKTERVGGVVIGS